nr:SPFH domain-containing protein [Planctomycetota bacterium]
MGFFDWAKNQFIEIIEWVDDSRSTLVHRFPVYRKEIKQGAKLTCREGQAAVFVSEGQIADVFGPGLHTLSTRNLPILATLKGWKYGFESPFKAEVYFVSTRLFTDLKWGTPNPVMLRDSDFGVLRLRAFGSFAMRVVDASAFLKEHIGTDGHLEQDAISGHLRNLVVSRFADVLGESKIPALDLAAKYDELAFQLQGSLNETFKGQGLGLQNVAIENISLPPEVEKALDARSKMAVIGDMNRYTQFQTAEAIPTAAANQGMGGAAMG